MLTLEEVSEKLEAFIPKKGLFKRSAPTPVDQNKARLAAHRERLVKSLLENLKNSPTPSDIPAQCAQILSDYQFFKKTTYGHNLPSAEDPFEENLKELIGSHPKASNELKIK